MKWSRAKNYSIKLSCQARGIVPVAHQGIQRSGTNYLNLCLRSLALNPINCYDPERNHPTHKHFRWQSNKDSIMSYDPRYYNDVIVDNVRDLNLICKYPVNCRHIVIKKDELGWATSILNWGIRVGWFQSKEQALGCIESVLKDYWSYYGFWEMLRKENEGLVAVLDLNEIQAEPSRLISVIESIGLTPHCKEEFKGEFDQVPKSPGSRLNYISKKDVLCDSTFSQLTSSPVPGR